MDLSRYAALFQTESREHLGGCGQALIEWERDLKATEPVVTLFRGMHTFKGMAAAMGFAHLTELAHRTETLLDVIRSDPGSATRDLLDLLFRIVDALEHAVPEAVAGADAGLQFGPLLEELSAASVASAPTGSWAIPSRGEAPEVAAPAAGRLVRIQIRPDSAMRGARAMLAIQRAEALGKVSAVRPPSSSFEQMEFDGKFSFRLESKATDAALADAIRTAGDIASVEVGEQPVAEAPEARIERRRQIRIDLRRLDALMNQVGELVVAKGRLSDLASVSDSPDLKAVAASISRVTTDMHGEIVQARMTPVWQVFDRFPRMVRDLSRQLGKRIAFEVEGEEIELDRAILEEIGDPLIHLLRNAVDHGIESATERKKRRKPSEGRIILSAMRDRTSVAIRVKDDGQGIDRQKILAKAVREGHVPAGTTTLTDDQLLRVLSRPGFTTASTVTDVSGRGVGMDAVLSKVRALGGSVELESNAGQGSIFTLRLPMTLAIVRALLARVGQERYAVPLAGVAETVEFNPVMVASLEGREAFVLRQELMPTVRLRERLGVTGPRPVGKTPTIIIQVGTRRAALVVDALVGQQEIVVEPFDAPKGMLPIFTGATILGDGVPALIVDPAALV